MAANVLVFSVLLPACVVFVQSAAAWRTNKVDALSLESTGVRLDGSRTSYAQLSAWSVCRNASLSFQFRTSRRSTALLVYADDGRRSFVQLRLVRGALQLRYRLPTTDDSLATIGDRLDDGNWHSVQLRSHDGRRLVVTLDEAINGEALRTGSGRFVAKRKTGVGTVWLTTGTYVGGLPTSAWRRPGDLAIPTVVFELRLVGELRNFRLSRCSAVSTSAAGAVIPAKLLGGRSVMAADQPLENRCGKNSPCLHGGLCVNTAAGPLCECDRTDFDGMTCSIGLFCRFLEPGFHPTQQTQRTQHKNRHRFYHFVLTAAYFPSAASIAFVVYLCQALFSFSLVHLNTNVRKNRT